MLRLRDQFGGGVAAGQHGGGGPHFFGQLDDRQRLVAPGRVQTLQARRFDIHRMPAHIELAGQTRCRAHGLLSAFVRPDAGQNGTFGVPDRRDGFFDAVTAHVVFHMLGGAPQGNLAQGDQVALAKKVLRRPLGLLRQINLAGFQAAEQLVGRHIDQDDFIGRIDHRVGHGFLHANAGDGTDGAVEAFQVLHIDRRPDINARVQQLLHVLPALGVARALDVAVRQFIDQQHVRLARQRRVQVKLLEAAAPVGNSAQRQLFKPGHQLGCFAAAMRFHHAQHDFAPGLVRALGGAEHGVGFADTGAGTKVNAQLAATRTVFVVAQLLQQLVGVGAGVWAGNH